MPIQLALSRVNKNSRATIDSVTICSDHVNTTPRVQSSNSGRHAYAGRHVFPNMWKRACLRASSRLFRSGFDRWNNAVQRALGAGKKRVDPGGTFLGRNAGARGLLSKYKPSDLLSDSCM